MDTVLGLSVTATNVQTVLVEGRGADGATLEHDEFNVFAGHDTARASEQVAEAVLSIASADGHRLHAIGVTWSEDADLEASLVLDSLAGLGFDNVVAVRSPHAAEALARSIGRVIGYERTAVCVVEPDSVMLSLVGTYDGEVETLVSHAIDSDEQLAHWLNAMFEREGWRPEGLFLVGSVGGLDSLAVWLEDQLKIPVFDPPEAQLALAHGAALASASGPLPSDAGVAGSPRRLPVGPIAMLVGGAVALVVSVSLAVSPHLAPQRAAVPTVERQVENAAVPQVQPQKVAPRQVPPPVQAPPPPPEAPVPAVVEELPPPAPEAPVVEPPAYEPVPSIEAIAPPAPAAPIQPINPIAPPPPAVVVPPVYEKPRLRDRIIDKIPGLNRLGD